MASNSIEIFSEKKKNTHTHKKEEKTPIMMKLDGHNMATPPKKKKKKILCRPDGKIMVGLLKRI